MTSETTIIKSKSVIKMTLSRLLPCQTIQNLATSATTQDSQAPTQAWSCSKARCRTPFQLATWQMYRKIAHSSIRAWAPLNWTIQTCRLNLFYRHQQLNFSIWERPLCLTLAKLCKMLASHQGSLSKPVKLRIIATTSMSRLKSS